jgi:intracellular septation protein
MKFLFDFFPIALFFLAYKLGDIYIATFTAILASLAQVLFGRFKKGHFEKFPLITLATITLLGGATLFFRNELFIKWKPTVVYWVLALAFLLSQWIGAKPLIQRAAEKSIQLNPTVWLRLNLSWVLFFAMLGGLNLYVVRHFDTNTWVNFKLFGTLGLTLLFVIMQGIYIMRHQLPEEIT